MSVPIWAVVEPIIMAMLGSTATITCGASATASLVTLSSPSMVGQLGGDEVAGGLDLGRGRGR